MGFQRIGTEFLVNTTTAGRQSESQVTGLSDGRFVVTWTDTSVTGGDTSSGAVRAQIFAADGSKSGGEFLVNTTTADDQADSSVTGLSDGRFIVTWTDASQTGGDTSGAAVRGQIFAADGSKSGSEFLVNTTTVDYQNGSSVASLSDGGFVVTWMDGTQYYSTATRGQIFAADGSKSGGEFPVGTAPAIEQHDAKVTGLSDGRFVVTWMSRDSGFVASVKGQIFAADGSKIGGEFPVGGWAGMSRHDTCSVTALADGGFVVTWTNSDVDQGPVDYGATSGQVFAADGSKVGGAFRVHTYNSYHQYDSSVTALADGRFVVTWTDYRNIDGTRTVLGQVFAADGSKSGSWFVVNTTRADTQDDSSVTALPDGRFVVTWTDASKSGGDTSDTAVRAQIFDPTRYDGVNASETVTGGNFADTIYAFGGDDTLNGAGGNDSLYGGAGSDIVRGGDGDDFLDGGGSADQRLDGGRGNDIIIVDDTGDVVVEAPGEGTDTVITSVSYVLKAGVEVEVLRTNSNAGTAAINLTGNGFAQMITGNAGNNILKDGGGAGVDTLRGLAGDDIYQVGNSGAIIVEAAGGGNDIVMASVDYVLKAGVEVETLRTNLNAGTAAIDLTGNSLKQTIVGNAGDNILNDGGGAADRMIGLGGNDIYQIANGGAVILEAAGEGVDTVMSSVDYGLKAGVEVETLRTNLNAGTAAIDLTGNELRQHVVGNAGSNILDGKGGNDKLQGLGGKDFFVFSTALGPDNVDTIVDFVAADDTVRLENAVFAKLTATGALNPGSFRANTAGIPADRDDYILYDTTDGKLYYDADGTGAGARIHFATLTGAPAITAADFEVI